MVMQNQPGDQLLSGLLQGQPLDGRKVGQTILQLMPALPHEGPPGMPRAMARQLFPRGFMMQPAAPAVPPAAMAPAPPVPPAPAAQLPGNGPAPAPAQPARQPEPKAQDRSLDPETVTARSQRVRISERSGL